MPWPPELPERLSRRELDTVALSEVSCDLPGEETVVKAWLVDGEPWTTGAPLFRQSRHAIHFVTSHERGTGAMVMHDPHKPDKVGSTRFASVYRSFQDVSDFRDAIKEVEAPTRRPRR